MVSVVIAVNFLERELSQKQEEIVEIILMGFVALISGYVGAKIQQRIDRNGRDE